jgi:hypothetical protein
VSDSVDRGRTQYQCQLSVYRDDVLYSRSETRAAQSEIRHPLKGYLLISRIFLSNLVPGSYRIEVEVALPDGRNRVSRSVLFQVD